MRRVPVVLALLLTALVLAGGAQALDRATADRPDEAVGPQVHVVYVVPADRPDLGLDMNGTIASWVGTFNDWLANQTGGVRVRFDTFQGQPDISFIRLAEPDASLSAQAGTENYSILNELGNAGLITPTKKYLVIVEGTNSGACGWGGGPVAALYLDGTQAGISCSNLPWPMVVGHEVFHALGAVDACAPHYLGGHTSDAGDLMSALELTAFPTLDPGHDDYYGPPGDDHLPATCPAGANTANSPFLTSHVFYRLSVAIAGSGEVQVAPVGSNCSTPTCEVDVEAGGQIELFTAPDPDFHFAGWTGGSCSGAGDCKLTVNGDTSVNATFAANPYLTVKIRGKGRVEIPGIGFTCTKPACRTQDVPYGEKTAVRAVPAKGSRFAGWSGPCHGARPVCNITTSAAATLAATFAARAR